MRKTGISGYDPIFLLNSYRQKLKVRTKSMRIDPKKLLAHYFNSTWIPFCVYMAALLAFLLSSILERLFPLVILSEILLKVAVIFFLGIIFASIWNFIRKRWEKGILNLVFILYSLIITVFCMIFFAVSALVNPPESYTYSLESESIQDSMRAKLLNRIKEETGLVFPEKSKLIHFFEGRKILDPNWVAKVIIPAYSYEHFKEAVLRKPVEKGHLSGALADSTSWWKPTNIILRRQYLEDDIFFVVIVLSKEDVNYAVYIECAVF